jgi:hypothetical protein
MRRLSVGVWPHKARMASVIYCARGGLGDIECRCLIETRLSVTQSGQRYGQLPPRGVGEC